MQIAVLVAALAVILVVGGVLLLGLSLAQNRRAAVGRTLDSRLAQARSARPTVGEASAGLVAPAGRSLRTGLLGWDRLLLRAGVQPTIGFYFARFMPILLIPVVLLLWIGPMTACGALILVTGCSLFLLWLRAEKRQRRMVVQLPAFLDAMVRLLTIGNSLSSAFQGAISSAVSPLDEVVGRADGLVRTGQELDVALRYVSRQYGIRELELVASVMTVAIRFGGRSDQVLERMGVFIRDLEQARSELHAMSAEVRVSAWVLAMLPIGIAAVIVTFNNRLFMGMWHDVFGFELLIGAAVLEVAGAFWLYRMAKAI